MKIGAAIEADKLATQHLDLRINGNDRLLTIDFDHVVHVTSS